MKILNVSHANCTDGMISSYVVRHFLGENEIDFLMMDYKDDFRLSLEARNAEEKDLIIITDFSFKEDYYNYVNLLMTKGVNIVVIDHHNDRHVRMLAGLEWVDRKNLDKINVLFSPERSGAWLTYTFLNSYDFLKNVKTAPHISGDMDFSKLSFISNTERSEVFNKPVQNLALLASDYDLFDKKYEASEYLNDYVQYRIKLNKGDVRLCHHDIDVAIFKIPQHVGGEIIHFWSEVPFLLEGRAYHDHRMELVKHVYAKPNVIIDARKLFSLDLLPKDLDDYTVYIFNANYPFVSAGSYLHKDNCLLVLSWCVEDRGIRFSIRSNKENGHDFSKLANYYEGGGHPSACGFYVDPDSPLPSKRHLIEVILGKTK